MEGYLLIEKARELSSRTGLGEITANFMALDLLNKGLTCDEVLVYMDDYIRENKPPHLLDVGDKCYILKEDGNIVETYYKDEDYFRNVFRMGNLFSSYRMAEQARDDRRICK